MSVETFPTTDLGSAAAAVLAKLETARPIKWPPKALVEGAPRQKITAPGIYDMPIELYHDPDLCDGPSVSASGLYKVYKQSLLHYWDAYVNPEREPYERSDAMTLGSAVHHLVLGESSFAEKFVIRPDEAPDGRAWHASNNSCKKWVAEQQLAGREILKADQVATIRGIAKNLEKHPLIQQGLLSGLVEQSIIVKDPETGLWLKSRPDVLALSSTAIVDLKTIADGSDTGCERMMKEREYYFQLGKAGICYELLFGRRPSNDDYHLVLCETKRPYPITIRPMDIGAISYGRMMVRATLRKLADAYARDEWPAYENDMKSLFIPAWRAKQLEADAKGGILREADAA